MIDSDKFVKNNKNKSIINLDLIKPLNTIFDSNKVVPIAFASSDFFAPYLGVTIQSIIDCSDSDYNYDLVVFTKDMSDFNKKILKDICCKDNFSIRFVNVKEIFDELNLYTPGHVTIETYFRLIIPVFMKKYHKILFLDSDLLVCKDVKTLVNIEFRGGYALAACEECLMSALLGIHGKKALKYMYDRLKLKDVDKYFQAGVMVMNVDYFNEHKCSSKLMEMVCNFDYNIVDQDAMNELLNDKVYWLPNEWNYPPLQKHMKYFKYIENMSDKIRKKYLAVKEPKILHFADSEKPWWDPTEDYAPQWWATARKSPYYEIIIANMIEKKIKNGIDNNNKVTDFKMVDFVNNVKHYKKNCIKYWKYKFLKNFVFGKTRERYGQKKALYKLKIRNARPIIKG